MSAPPATGASTGHQTPHQRPQLMAEDEGIPMRFSAPAAAPADHHGQRPCTTCGLPRRHASHTDPTPAGPDVQTLAAGDTPDTP